MQTCPQFIQRHPHDDLQAVSFEIANGNTRQGCILQTKFQTKVAARKYLLTNWPIIERMAREALATGTLEDGQIKLVML
jgi:hypothetical protein